MAKVQELEVHMAELRKDISYIKDLLENNVAEHKDMRTEMRTFFDQADQRYASKNIEKAFWGAVGTVGTVLITAGLYVIFKFGPELVQYIF